MRPVSRANVQMNQTNLRPPLPKTSWVLPGQLFAGEHPIGPDDGVTRQRLGVLLEIGIRTIVDLTGEEEGAGYYQVLRGLADEKRLEVTYVRIPVGDGDVPSVWTMRCILDVIDRSVADENPVFVHCRAGLGRTGTVVGCYLKRHDLATDQNVISRIAELRQVSCLAGNSPQSPEQIRMVQVWKKGA